MSIDQKIAELEKSFVKFGMYNDVAIFNQGDPQWKTEQLGNGSKTVGQSGCLLSSLVILQRSLRPLSVETPSTANAKIKSVKNGFVGSGLNVRVAAPVIGLSDKYKREAIDDDNDIKRIIAGCKSGLRYILGIDYKSGGSSAVSDADHFVFVVGVDEKDEFFVVADPNGGKLRAMPASKNSKYIGKDCELAEFFEF